MSVDTDLVDKLLADTTIAANVSEDIYIDHAPQDTAAPYLVVTRVSGARTDTLDGSESSATLDSVNYQIDVIASSPSSRETIADAIGAELHQYRGTMGSTTVRGCVQIGRFNAPEPPADAGQVREYRAVLEFGFGVLNS